ncbi:unnamed protein product [Euphydryas editha]|uniref:Uncharacterized protein n=1 Tax=Euphydryas editha TaxID=104508 RepID=A0AAU9U6J9_EUPED|nr:unnamed protein product [Euphydryas editha]
MLITFKYTSCIENRDSVKILTYEYGNHTNEEILSFVHTGVIPAFIPRYNLSVKPIKPEQDKTFTYLRVQYANDLSPVVVDYDINNYTLNFYIKYPFINFPFGVEGYS